MIILDTHALIWWINKTPNKLKPSIIALIEETEELAISCISSLEVAWLARNQRIRLNLPLEQWIERVIALNIKVLPITHDIAITSAALPIHHRDPMDRLIISTAIFHNAKLISVDDIFPKYQTDGLQLIL